MPVRVDALYLICSIIVVDAFLIAGCALGPAKPGNMTPPVDVPGTQTTMVTPVIMQLRVHPSNLTINENAELHAGNLSLEFSVKDKGRDPVKQIVSIELAVKNVGNETVADLQTKLSELYAVDRSGMQYSVPTHVALIGLEPGERRSGTVEIANVPDQALPGLVFHYKFGNEEASWVIIPEIPV